MRNSVKSLSFKNDKEGKSHLKSFFSSKPASFSKTGIMKLTEWWNKVIGNYGKYAID